MNLVNPYFLTPIVITPGGATSLFTSIGAYYSMTSRQGISVNILDNATGDFGNNLATYTYPGSSLYMVDANAPFQSNINTRLGPLTGIGDWDIGDTAKTMIFWIGGPPTYIGANQFRYICVRGTTVATASFTLSLGGTLGQLWMSGIDASGTKFYLECASSRLFGGQEWSMIAFTHDPINDRVGISVNGQPYSYRTVVGGLTSTSQPMYLAEPPNGTSNGAWMWGPVMVFNSTFSESDIAKMYRGGEGRFFDGVDEIPNYNVVVFGGRGGAANRKLFNRCRGVYSTSNTGAMYGTMDSPLLSSRNYYFEAELLSSGKGADDMNIGLARVDGAATTATGNGVPSHEVMFKCISGIVVNNNSTVDTIPAASIGDIVSVAVNGSTGKCWFGVNGTFNGDPAAGTGESYTIPATNLAYGMLICYGCNNTNAGNALEIQTSANYSIPTGFEMWPLINPELNISFPLSSYLTAYYPFNSRPNSTAPQLDSLSGLPLNDGPNGTANRLVKNSFGSYISNILNYITTPALSARVFELVDRPWSASMWILPDTIPGSTNHFILFKTNEMRLFINNSGVTDYMEFNVWSGTGWLSAQAPQPITEKQPYLLCVRYDPGVNIGISVNGQTWVNGAAPASVTATANPIYIGYDLGSGANSLYGTIGELAIYNKVLSQDDAVSLFGGGDGIFYRPDIT